MSNMDAYMHTPSAQSDFGGPGVQAAAAGQKRASGSPGAFFFSFFFLI